MKLADAALSAFPLAQRTKKYCIGLCVLFFAYAAAAQVAFLLFDAPALISPAAGIALAGLVIGGIRLWPAIFFASLTSSIFNGLPIMLALSLPPAAALQAVFAAYALKRLGFKRTLSRTRDLVVFTCVAFLAATIMPSAGYIAAFAHQALAADLVTMLPWDAWWVGTALSILAVAPVCIRWSVPMRSAVTVKRLLEISAVFVAFIAVNAALWLTDQGGYLDLFYLYASLSLLAWMALRFGSRSTSLGIFVFTAICILGMYYGVRASAEPLGPQILGIEMLIIPVTLIFFLLMSIGEERKTAQRKLREHVQKLEHALHRIQKEDEAKSHFIAILAHELRNPLAPIVSSVELLQLNEQKRTEDAELYDVIEERAHVMRRLLDDLLDAGRISTKKLALQKKHFDLRDVITSTVHSMRGNLESREQTLTLNIPEHSLPMYGDPVRMEQICVNLLSNATKFTKDRGSISITAAADEKTVSFCVTDNGIGIEPQMCERIFEPFLQTGHTRGSETGLGIGLSLAHDLVVLQGGNIRAHSEGIGRGCAFTVTFPRASAEQSPERSQTVPAHASSAAPQKKHVPLPREQGGKILVVDDNTAAADGIKKLLQLQSGLQTEVAYSGVEAKKKVASFGPDTIVLDIGLPDIDGHHVARALRDEHRFTGTLVALTGYGQDEDKQKAKEAGFDQHLTKPISIDELLSICEKS